MNIQRPLPRVLLLCLALLPPALVSSAEMTEVPALSLPPPRPAQSRERRAELRTEMQRISAELEQAFPQAARVVITKHTARQDRTPVELTESADISYAVAGGRFLYRADLLREVRPGVTERQQGSYDGVTRRTAKLNASGNIVLAHIGDTPQPYGNLREVGLEYLLPRFAERGLTRMLVNASRFPAATGMSWRVLELTQERALLMFPRLAGEVTFVEFDLTRGGNLVRWELWSNLYTAIERREAWLTAYELVELEGHWLPKRYDFVNAPQGSSTLSYSYDWRDLALKPNPSNFAIDVSAAVSLVDENSVLYKAWQQKENATQWLREAPSILWNLLP